VRKPLIVIENLEEYPSKWLLAEYRHAARLAGGRLVITNAQKCCSIFSGIAKCYELSIVELEGVLYSRQENVIVLDPKADQRLSPSEAASAEVIVVGGILGDHPPRGRTKALLSSRLPRALKRSLGSHQLSIDGAVYVAAKVAEGMELDEIELTVNPTVKIGMGEYGEVEVELPYAYPLVEGRPLVSSEVIGLLARGLGYEELRLAKGKLKRCF
jgi:ribosome biogenesis SPOUT family RNA methylase Rps3